MNITVQLGVITCSRFAIGFGGGSRRKRFFGEYKYPGVPPTLHRTDTKNRLAAFQKIRSITACLNTLTFHDLAFLFALLYSKAIK
jgi:hypothetical protein